MVQPIWLVPSDLSNMVKPTKRLHSRHQGSLDQQNGQATPPQGYIQGRYTYTIYIHLHDIYIFTKLSSQEVIPNRLKIPSFQFDGHYHLSGSYPSTFPTWLNLPGDFTPVSRALWIIRTLKPLHHSKVIVKEWIYTLFVSIYIIFTYIQK